MGGLHTVFFFVLLLRCRVTLGYSFPFAVICFICLENGSAVIGLQMVWRHGVVYEQYSFKLKNNYFNISQWTKHHNEYHSFSQNTISGWKARDSKLSVAQSYPALPHKWQHSICCHQLLELAQTHLHPVGDAIQPSHPLSSPLLLPSIFLKILNVCSKHKHLK